MIPNVSPFKPGDKVVAYCRYSEGDEQGLKNQSTEEQADAIRAFCDANGLILTRVFADPFASGRSVAKRDHYLEMLSFLLHKKKPDVHGVVLWDFERYGRNYDQAQLDAARLRMAGYKLFSLQQPIMDDGPFSHVLEAMYFASAQNQSDMISADVKRALQHNFQTYKVIPRSSIGWGWIPEPVDMGVLSDGSPRIGYRSVPDPEKADLIRDAIKARLHGASIKKCRLLLGCPSYIVVKRLFANPLLHGQMTYGATTIEDYCDPIIDKQTFDTLQMYERTHNGRQIGRQGGWSADPPMLSGLLYCASCGEPMYIYRRKSKGHLYCSYYCEKTCFPGIKQALIEPRIIELCGEILTPDNIRKWINMLSDAETEETASGIMADCEKELDTITKKINGVLDLLLSHPSESLAEKVQQLETRRKELQERMKSLTQRDSAAIDTDTIYKSTLELSNRILDVLRSPDTSPETKRIALKTFVRSIVIDDHGKIIINYSPPGFSPESCNPNQHRPIIKPAETGLVVSQSRLSPIAPPENVFSGLQHSGHL